MPGGVYLKGQDVAFYHEVYNLRADEAGHCVYRIEYRLYDRGRDDQRLLLARDITAAESDTYQAGRIPAAFG